MLKIFQAKEKEEEEDRKLWSFKKEMKKKTVIKINLATFEAKWLAKEINIKLLVFTFNLVNHHNKWLLWINFYLV